MTKMTQYSSQFIIAIKIRAATEDQFVFKISQMTTTPLFIHLPKFIYINYGYLHYGRFFLFWTVILISISKLGAFWLEKNSIVSSNTQLFGLILTHYHGR